MATDKQDKTQPAVGPGDKVGAGSKRVAPQPQAARQAPKPFDPKSAPPEAPSLGAGALEGAEFVRNHWAAKIEAGLPFAVLLAPEFWAHHAYQLKPWDRIECRSADGQWYAEVIVADTSRNWARVVPIIGPLYLTTRDVSMTQASTQAVEDEKKKMRTQYRNQHGWCVVRISDSAVLEHSLGDKQAAEEKIDEIARKSVGAPPKLKAPAAAAAPA